MVHPMKYHTAIKNELLLLYTDMEDVRFTVKLKQEEEANHALNVRKHFYLHLNALKHEP